MSDAKSRMERILNHLAEIDEIKAVVREIYAEEKADGGDKTAMGSAIAIIRKRNKIGAAAVEERDGLVDTYLSAFDRLTHTHAREANEPSPRRAVPTAHPESEHVTRSASAQPHSAVSVGGPSILSKPGDEGTGQGVFDRHETFGTPSGAEAGSAVRTGAPIREDA